VTLNWHDILSFGVATCNDRAPEPNRPAIKGCRGGFFARLDRSSPDGIVRSYNVRQRAGAADGIQEGLQNPTESKMPKLKTKSGAAKRFKITGTGKVVYAQAGKRHGMIKRTNKQIRNLRGTNVLFKTDGDNVKKYFLPNG
jgi:large subunit ribosomal protein L35